MPPAVFYKYITVWGQKLTFLPLFVEQQRIFDPMDSKKVKKLTSDPDNFSFNPIWNVVLIKVLKALLSRVTAAAARGAENGMRHGDNRQQCLDIRGDNGRDDQ
jgi:hypothetical protein